MQQPPAERSAAHAAAAAEPTLDLRTRARRITLAYIVIAGGWILTSEWVVGRLDLGLDALLRISVLKGIGYVLITGTLLHALLDRVFGRISHGVAAIARNEATLQRLTRVHRAGHAMSRAITHASPADDLLTEACRILVEEGGFSIAWIGWEDEARKTLAPVASWGDREGGLADVVIRTDDAPEGRGPSGTAYREGRPYVCNDLFADPATMPWRDLARRGGVHASATFPIRREGRPRGTLSVYATRPDVFQEEEVQLLTTVADEISAALDALDLDGRRAAAEAAAQAERRFSDTMISTGPGVMFLYDVAGRFLRWNPNIERITGYSADEIAAMSALDFVPDGDRAEVAATMARAVETGEGEVETDLLAKDGTTTPYYFLGRSIEFDGTTCLVCTGIDISERAAAETALRASEAGTRALLEAIPHMVWIARPDGNPVDFNQRWLDYTGQTLEESLDHGWRSVIHPDDRERADRRWDAATSSGQQYEIEYRLCQADGTYHWMLGRALPLRDDSGAIVRWVGTCTDIDELKAAQVRIAEQAALLDLTQDAIVVLDLDRRVRYWNAGAETLFGWTATEAVGAAVHDLHDPDPDQYAAAVEALLQHGAWTGELRYVARSGDEVLVEGRWTLLRDDDGNPRSVLAVDTDVTERRRIEEQFLRAQRFESIGTLASGLAHDLNNLLAPVVMGVGLLRDQQDAQTQLVVDAMEKSAQRGADLVKQVMSFTKGTEAERTEVVVQDVVDEVIAITSTTFPKDLHVESDLPEDLWPVVADPTQLHQVLLNLCVNARDAMPDGGVITIAARNQHIDAQYAEMDQRATVGDHLLLEVIDQGCGMAPDVLDRIFEPFFTTKRPDRGTGLGLSTVMNIVRGHDGFIDVRSHVGRGTTFSVHLPAQTGTPEWPTPAAEGQHAHPRGEGELVLVVDDEPVILDITRRTLESYGYQVMTAPDGAEAMGVFAMHQDDVAVVLTDMMMPVMDGAALISALRSIDPSVAVVATSGVTASGTEGRALATGAQAFLSKPYSAERLLRTLRAVLGDRAAGEDASSP